MLKIIREGSLKFCEGFFPILVFKNLYGIAWSKILIEPPPYAQQRRRRGERGTGVTKGS
jgi:hypothetical protein